MNNPAAGSDSVQKDASQNSERPRPLSRSMLPIVQKDEILARIERLERDSMLGMVSFLFLSEIIANVRNEGALTSAIVEVCLNELSDYLSGENSAGNASLVCLLRCMQRGDTPDLI